MDYTPSLPHVQKFALRKMSIKVDSLGFKKLPNHFLDFQLVGDYRQDEHPLDYYTVLYYSSKQNSLMVQYQMGFNNITDVSLYMSANDTVNPLKKYQDFFKLGDNNFKETVTIKMGGK